MKKRTKIILASLVLIIGLVITGALAKRITPLSWNSDQVNVPLFSNQAINGYDPVAYFTENKAVEGKENHTLSWKGADWYFSTAENKSLFEENAEAYAPQFGGFCSFAVSKGFTANTDPNTFEVIDGKLYLFADEGMKANWKANQTENMKKCTDNWK